MSEHDEQLEAFRRALARKEQAVKEASQNPQHDKAPGKLGRPKSAHTHEERQAGAGERGGS